MKAGKYNFQSLFVNRYVAQWIIPEIQRDYVWEEKQVKGLLNSLLKDYKAFKEAVIPKLDYEEQEDGLCEEFSKFYLARKHSSNIGFLYAYSDNQYENRYFLIDGQQRVTTIYLLLLVLAVRYGEKADFLKYYCKEGIPKLDYRVRESAQTFLSKLVNFVLNKDSLDVRDQSWCLDFYQNDVTVQHIMNSLTVMDKWFDENGLESEDSFYNYINQYTEFWYFDTNISAQGEQLYIYLNARGEQTQGNENLKAELLNRVPEDNKNNLGKQWEQWQDFFWIARKFSKKETANADRGFNEFLSCITGLEIYLKDESEKWRGEEESVIPTGTMVQEVLDITLIKRYMKVLNYLNDTPKNLSNKYDYSGWLDELKLEFWGLFNNEKTAWIIRYKNENLSTQQRRMVFMWGIIHWVDRAINGSKEFSEESVFRGIRQFYLRYRNNIRRVTEIKDAVENLYSSGYMVAKKDSSEESRKERWLENVNDFDQRLKLESVLWEIEDHPFNINGTDVGHTNSSHLVDYADVELEILIKIRDKMYQTFPKEVSKDTANLPVIQSLLLFYGFSGERKSPWYYKNYKFNNWRVLIRSFNYENEIFRQIFDDLIKKDCSAQELLNDKRGEYDLSSMAGTFSEQLLWYNYHIKERMWEQGAFIALHGTKEQSQDKYYPSEKPFKNTKGNFNGGNPSVLSSLMESMSLEEVKDGQ